jgi:hypothetical protein
LDCEQLYFLIDGIYIDIIPLKLLAQDESNDDSFYKRTLIFLLDFGFLYVTESIMSWDWIMSIDPHWFSTLFGWYVL